MDDSHNRLEQHRLDALTAAPATETLPPGPGRRVLLPGRPVILLRRVGLAVPVPVPWPVANNDLSREAVSRIS